MAKNCADTLNKCPMKIHKEHFEGQSLNYKLLVCVNLSSKPSFGLQNFVQFLSKYYAALVHGRNSFYKATAFV